MTKSGTPTDQQLVADILRGDISAKKCLYCRYAGYLTGVCSRFVTGSDDVKDVLQESFLKIFSAIGTFEWRGPGSLRGWMARIVVNESLRALRTVFRFELLPDEGDGDGDDGGEMAYEPPDTDGIPLTELHAMIRELPVGYRTILNLHVFEGKSHKEIAQALHITESTSASQFHRAKRLLADKIRKHNHTNLSIDYGR